MQSLQSELVSHVHLSKSTLDALGDALEEIAALRDENERLSEELERARAREAEKAAKTKAEGEEDVAKELAIARAELEALKQKHEELRLAKQKADDKHAEDYLGWKKYKLFQRQQEQQKQQKRDLRAAKRRKLNPQGNGDQEDKKRGDRTPTKSDLRRKSPRKSKSRSPRKNRTASMRDVSPCPAVLISKSLNSSSSNSPSSSTVTTPSKSKAVGPMVHKVIKRNSTIKIPKVEDVPGSSETEPDSQRMLSIPLSSMVFSCSWFFMDSRSLLVSFAE